MLLSLLVQELYWLQPKSNHISYVDCSLEVKGSFLDDGFPDCSVFVVSASEHLGLCFSGFNFVLRYGSK